MGAPPRAFPAFGTRSADEHRRQHLGRAVPPRTPARRANSTCRCQRPPGGPPAPACPGHGTGETMRSPWPDDITGQPAHGQLPYRTTASSVSSARPAASAIIGAPRAARTGLTTPLVMSCRSSKRHRRSAAHRRGHPQQAVRVLAPAPQDHEGTSGRRSRAWSISAPTSRC